MGEHEERFLLSGLNEFHAGMVFPGPQWIFGLLGRVIVLLSDESAGIGDHTTKPVGSKPAHRQCGRATRTATHYRSAPWVFCQSKLWESSFDLHIFHDLWQHLVMHEAGQAIGHRVVFETALALFAIIAAVFDSNGDESRQLAIRIRRNG